MIKNVYRLVWALLVGLLGCALLVGGTAANTSVQAAHLSLSDQSIPKGATLTIDSTNATRDKDTDVATATIQTTITFSDDLFMAGHEGAVINCQMQNKDGVTFKGKAEIIDSKSGKGANQYTVTIPLNRAVEGSFTATCTLDANSMPNLASSNAKIVNVPCREARGGMRIASSLDACVAPATGAYNVYVVAVGSGGSVFIGQEADVTKPSCQFTDGGLCHENDPNVPILNTLGGPYGTYDEAKAAYCKMLSETHEAFGGIKGTVNGHLYWLDNVSDAACSGK